MNKWKLYQSFLVSLSLKEVKRVRRHLIAIEKALFLEGVAK